MRVLVALAVIGFASLASCSLTSDLTGGHKKVDSGADVSASDSGADAGARDASVDVTDTGPPVEASGPGFSVSAPSSLTLEQGASAPVTVSVKRRGGFTGAIAFGVSGLPAGATSNPLTITSDSTSGALTIAVSDTTPQSVSHLSIDGVTTGGTISASAKMDLVVRGPAGSLDALYGDQGVASGFLTTTNFGTFDAAALDASGNLLIAIDSQLGGGNLLVVRIRPDGTLDPAFGTGGIATVPNTGVSFKAIFPLATGDIELCGLSENGSPWTDETLRLTPKGAVDSSFSEDGGLGYAIVRTDGQPYVFTLDATDRVVETGFTGNAANFLLTRRTAAGALDSTFNASFSSSIGGPGGPTVVQPDGKIVASYAGTHPPYAMGLVRAGSSGDLDSSFGTSGVVPANGPGNPSALLLQSDGKFLAGGVTFSSTGIEMPGGFVARFNSNGSIDATYGAAGVAAVTPGNVWAMAEQANQDAVTVGYPWAAGDAGSATNDLWLERLTAGGLPDPKFGTEGIATTPVGGGGEICRGEFVAVQSDGRIVVVASTMKSQGVFDFAAVRYWP
jgi:uncharacterized delta-60 repeat protein